MIYIIDTDGGVDDAIAFTMLEHFSTEKDLIYICTVFGNVAVDQATENMLKICAFLNLDIPVFKGAFEPLTSSEVEVSKWPGHGDDGLGNATKVLTHNKKCESEHAANAIVRIVDENESNELCYIGIGPLTNLALAAKLNKNLFEKLKNIVIMGGSTSAKGNSSKTAEFNFHSDCDAAQIIFQKVTTPIKLISWDLCLNHGVSWEIYDKITRGNKRTSELLSLVSKTYEKFVRTNKNLDMKEREIDETNFMPCDAYSIMVALNPSVIKESCVYRALVEVHGEHTRGSLVIDWYNREKEQIKNCEIIEVLSTEIIEKMFMQVFF